MEGGWAGRLKGCKNDSGDGDGITMIHFECVQCSRRHKVHESVAGATVRCPCGQLMTVPAPATPENVPAVVEERISLTCVCGKKLSASKAAVGKSVRCSCGEVLMVAGSAEPETPQPSWQGGFDFPSGEATDNSYSSGQAHADDWFNSALPAATPNQNYSASPQGSGYSPYVPSYAPATPPNTNPYGPSYTNDYIRNAQQESSNRRESEHVEASAELTAARWALIVLGLLTIFVNLVLFLNVRNEMATVAQQAAAEGEVIDIALFEGIGRVFYGFTMLVGVFFIVLGVSVYQFPLAAPIIGLGLYITGILMYLVLNPLSLISPLGIMIKIGIIGTLIKAINSGAYYRRR